MPRAERTRVPRSARHHGPPSPPIPCRPRERLNSTRRLLPHTPRGRGARPLARSQQPPGHSDARRTQLRLCTAGPPAPAVWTPSSARPTAPPDPRPRRPALGSTSHVTRLVARRPPLATTRDALTRTAEPTHSPFHVKRGRPTNSSQRQPDMPRQPRPHRSCRDDEHGGAAAPVATRVAPTRATDERPGARCGAHGHTCAVAESFAPHTCST